MVVRKKYKQLKFEVEVLQHHYEMVYLNFKLNRNDIHGVLNGSAADWTFHSNSPAFLRVIPSGKLSKYAIWYDRVPKQLHKIYNGIWEAAIKAGYDIAEKEELV